MKGLNDMSSSSIFAVLPRAAVHCRSLSPIRFLGASLIAIALVVTALPAPSQSAEQVVRGSVRDSEGAPIVGAMVSLRQGKPFHERTVFTDQAGAYQSTLRGGIPFTVRVRRLGWRDLRRADLPPLTPEAALAFDHALERETDPAALAAQLPANHWFGLLLAEIEDEGHREEFVRQCTYCHQQGSRATRLLRDDVEWEKILSLMARMGGVLSQELREKVPGLWRRAFDREQSVAALMESTPELFDLEEAASPLEDEVLRAAVDEWALGHPASMQHDLAVHPDGRVYSVDMMQDKLYRFDPETEARDAFALPHGNLPLGGVFGAASGPLPPNANAFVGPHSLQVAPDGAVWLTLALGSQLARFDAKDETWEIHDLEEGIYPHTLRFDQEGRIWYTMAVSNHVGLLDPATGKQTSIRLPASSFAQGLALRAIPIVLWLGKYFDMSGVTSGEGGGSGPPMPVPYGIDVAPDGDVWFSQLNEHRIGRIDPKTLEVEMVDTPFSAPRRLRFDSKGRLWIPGFSSGLVSRFDPESREFESYPLPIEPVGTETPYALNVHPETDHVWICGTNSDTMIRFDPERESFTVFPLPTRVTYTREVDFDEQGRVWTSNSNLPAWQIEGGMPRILRLDPTFQSVEAVGMNASAAARQ
ncbi:MAG: hypothetical protein QF570_19345 [Myxococcota bacterium]|jgi:streptogramin lyase|nr:hypothetical protein [Myxococcota bacterium]